MAWGDPTNGGDCQEVAEDLRQRLVSADLWYLSNSSITIPEDVFFGMDFDCLQQIHKGITKDTGCSNRIESV